ncbi:5'-nucleotidase C-terminal domain-containing protein [Rhodobacteraceae bacterium 2376]|uniref:5'-nucleotidase C-terminal domain-containing protein n=1 Tax=Rhabdonatronobacter sediminivivens TaxID=2743469 RepID=A0A7Z0HZR3_9RHOB|nr:5'-nucleotidase C-terminal domain-containing protein [Rhabdonatronobacter sediminivivens]NYS25263.1 5'-nucleotidase C-terminal domain-containing protein [Rhabdonatronobacter sediminivivens]
MTKNFKADKAGQPLRGVSRRGFLALAGASLAMTGAGAFTMTSARAGGGFRLGVLHINDMHSRLAEISRHNSTCSDGDSADGNCFGGAARLATAIREHRADMDGDGLAHVTLDAGDQSQGTLFYTTYRGRAEIEMMNMIGFDAMALGNHEFNNGPDSLAEMISTAEFPVISGNTNVAEGPLGDVLGEYVVVERDGERIAVLAVTTPDTAFISSPGPHVTFTDDIVYLQEAVDRVRGDGIDKILLLSHVGFGRDQQIAAQVDGISAIIGGHSHTLLSNTVEDAPAYATLVESPAGRAVPIVQAYAFSRYLGRLELEFGDDGAVVAASGDTILLDASFAEAEDLKARIEELAEPIEEMVRTPVATLAAGIDGSRESCRAMECEMGNTVGDALLEAVEGQGITIALGNGGGLRASLGEGTVTLGDVLTVLPFQNTLYTLEVTGATLVAALEHGVNAIEDGAGRFPQVAGLRFRLDPSVAPNEGRVSEVEVRDGDAWAPIDPEAVYGIVTNNFMAGGGDGYAMLATEGMNGYDTAIDMAEVLAQYLSAHEPFAPVIDGRILQ